MSDTLQFIPFRSCEDRGWSEAWKLYVDSFPPNERWHEEDYAEAMRSNPLFQADGVWLDDRLAGIVFHWQGAGYRYIEFLAVMPHLRGQNIGSRIMREMIGRGERIILEIEPPVDEMTCRRLRFYEHLGLRLNDNYEYLHPSYHRPFQTYPLVLMSYPDLLTRNEAAEFTDFVRGEVLRYSEHENPRLPLIERE